MQAQENLWSFPLQALGVVKLSAMQCTAFTGIEKHACECAGHTTNPRTSHKLVAEGMQALQAFGAAQTAIPTSQHGV